MLILHENFHHNYSESIYTEELEMNRRKQITLIILMLLGLVGTYLFTNLDTVALKSDVFTFEYGDDVRIKAAEILDTENPKILDSLTIDQSQIKLEENKEYPKVGKYRVNVNYTVFYQNRSQDITVIVSDTTKPAFIEAPEKIVIKATESQPDLTSDFIVEDLSRFKLKFDTSSVIFDQAGTYNAKAFAIDIYGNKAIHNFEIVVEEKVIDKPNVVEQNEPKEKLTEDKATEQVEETIEAESLEEKNQAEAKPSDPTIKPIVPTIRNGILVVNKKHPLPEHYGPGENSQAVTQLEKMIHEMQRLGLDVSDSYSGFRTYQYQKKLYERYVSNEGKEAADRYSARPGYSEHQTGFAFDLKHIDGTLVEQPTEVKWIAENAAEYGFIVRYQEGKEEITGYEAEPWHLRYIGEEAIDIYRSGLALEEYLGVEGGDYHLD